MTTLDDLVPDQLWAIVEPLLPVPPRPPYGSRRRTIATVGRRLDAWAAAGVFDQLHLEVLDRLGERGEVNRMRAAVDTMGVRARDRH
jgi:transposase